MKKTTVILSVLGLVVVVLAAVMVRSCRTGDAPHTPTGGDVESTTSQVEGRGDWEIENWRA
jgi:hypothetical protein